VPKTYREALNSVNRVEWLLALQEEFSALQNSETWTLEKLPKGAKVIGSRWVLSVKLDAEGNIIRFKARLVAKGYTQTQGLDVFETFAPVVAMSTLRCVLGMSFQNSWKRVQMDVSTAFLHAGVSEDIYVKQAVGFESLEYPDYVYKLQKSLYGLKQSPRNWFQTLRKSLLDSNLGIVSSQVDECVFYVRTPEGIVIILVYVDDLLITGNLEGVIAAIVDMLCAAFPMKMLGEPEKMLGLQFAKVSEGTVLHQRMAIEMFVEEYARELSMLRPVSTPMSANINTEYMDSCFLDPPLKVGMECESKFDYRHAIGTLIYLANSCRPDIANAVRFLSTFVVSYTQFHIDCALRVIKYLEGTTSLGVLLHDSGEVVLSAQMSKDTVKVYTDASWADNYSDATSNSGVSVWLGESLIHWRSVKQRIVAQSTMESEYIAMSLGVDEVLFFKELLRELVGVSNTVELQGCSTESYGVVMDAVCLLSDNMSAITVGNDNASVRRSRHINLRMQNVKAAVQAGEIVLRHVSSSDNLADFLTKALNITIFRKFRDLILRSTSE
jgi:hypothetical protein